MHTGSHSIEVAWENLGFRRTFWIIYKDRKVSWGWPGRSKAHKWLVWTAKLRSFWFHAQSSLTRRWQDLDLKIIYSDSSSDILEFCFSCHPWWVIKVPEICVQSVWGRRRRGISTAMIWKSRWGKEMREREQKWIQHWALWDTSGESVYSRCPHLIRLCLLVRSKASMLSNKFQRFGKVIVEGTSKVKEREKRRKQADLLGWSFQERPWLELCECRFVKLLEFGQKHHSVDANVWWNQSVFMTESVWDTSEEFL